LQRATSHTQTAGRAMTRCPEFLVWPYLSNTVALCEPSSCTHCSIVISELTEKHCRYFLRRTAHPFSFRSLFSCPSFPKDTDKHTIGVAAVFFINALVACLFLSSHHRIVWCFHCTVACIYCTQDRNPSAAQKKEKG
jgi:hypothetical protein